jgi:exo-1,4-beta-D-glucosaminidase
MAGPYEHVPPIYWYMTAASPTGGGAFGFNTEHGPGVTIDTAESLSDLDPSLDTAPGSKILPFAECGEERSLRSFALQQHAGTKVFLDGQPFFHALCRRYGMPRNMAAFLRKAQLQNYEDHRALNEAHGRNRHKSAFGHIYWMGMNGWPSLRWHLFDYHLRTGGTFHGAQAGNRMLNAQYSYDDHSLWLVNRSAGAARDLSLSVRVFDRSHRVILDKDISGLEVDANASASAGYKLPIKDLIQTIKQSDLGDGFDSFFVMLKLSSGENEISSNFYWLSREQDKMAQHKFEYLYGKLTSTARFTDLDRMENVKPVIRSATPYALAPGEDYGDGGLAGFEVEIANPSHDKLSIFWKIVPVPRSKAEGAEEIRFQLWSENFVTLLPGETRRLKVMVDKRWRENIQFEVRPH